jgi:hypothetical protein
MNLFMLASQVNKQDQASYYTTMQKGDVFGGCFWVYSYYYTKLEKAWNTKEKREGHVNLDDSAGFGVGLSSHWGAIYRGEKAWQDTP